MPRVENDIVISDPQENRDKQRRYTSLISCLPGFPVATGDKEGLDLSRFTAEGIISPDKFPLVVDLFAGDGSWAEKLVARGWKAESITCIDKAKTLTPLVAGVNWHYWDLALLARAIKSEVTFHEEVAKLMGRFDLAFMSFGACYIPSTAAGPDNVCSFFVRKGGLVYVEGDLKLKGGDGRLIPIG